MRHQPLASAKAAAATAGTGHPLCSLVVIYFPDFALGLAWTWFHGLNIPTNQTIQISLVSFVSGLVMAMLAAWVAGYLIAGFYNYFSRTSH